jgi:DNA polymerase-3 subunit delta
VVDCAKITRPGERLDFVRAEIRSAGGTATPEAVAALVDAVGNDLRELASAAGQMVADTGGMIDESAVRRYHRGRAEVSGFTVSDLAVAGNIAGALEALRWALSIGVPQVVIADALADGVRTIAKVASAGGGNPYQLASQLGMPPWKIDRARGPARGWSAAALARAMATVAELNADVKGQAADPDYALERAVMDIGRARRMGSPR